MYNLLLGYTDAPENFELSEGMYYNKWIDGNQIAMAPPLDEGYVDYDDGTSNTLPQLAEDVVSFLKWSVSDFVCLISLLSALEIFSVFETVFSQVFFTNEKTL